MEIFRILTHPPQFQFKMHEWKVEDQSGEDGEEGVEEFEGGVFDYGCDHEVDCRYEDDDGYDYGHLSCKIRRWSLRNCDGRRNENDYFRERRLCTF